jgi:hypothetical protein
MLESYSEYASEIEAWQTSIFDAKCFYGFKGIILVGR